MCDTNKYGKNKEHKDLMTQENQTGKKLDDKV